MEVRPRCESSITYMAVISDNVVFFFKGVVQTIQEEFDYNGESNLDLQYAMNLVNLVGSEQDVILYQVGDIPQGLRLFLASFSDNELTSIILDRGILQ